MDISLSQATILAVIQGLTEFLPISSSAHLILPSILFDWDDQGLTFDVALHLGSLSAVLIYFRQDIRDLREGVVNQMVDRRDSKEGKLAWFVIIGTIPGAIAGFFLNNLIELYTRSLIVLAMSTFIFALILLYADKRNPHSRSLIELNWKEACYIGVAQAISLIPGTSRSGITMTAALLLGYSRKSAAKFSFLLAIPIILGSTALRFSEFFGESSNDPNLFLLFYGALISAVVAYGCIYYFLQLIEKIGFLPFVAYRILLAMILFVVYVN